jgi:hypothetical protein
MYGMPPFSQLLKFLDGSQITDGHGARASQGPPLNHSFIPPWINKITQYKSRIKRQQREIGREGARQKGGGKSVIIVWLTRK